jgi:hypothetical protein
MSGFLCMCWPLSVRLWCQGAGGCRCNRSKLFDAFRFVCLFVCLFVCVVRFRSFLTEGNSNTTKRRGASFLCRIVHFFFGGFKAHLQNCERRLLASCCPSVRPRGTSRLSLEGFSWNFSTYVFRKSARKVQGLSKRVLYKKTDIHSWSSLAQCFLEQEMFQSL